MATPRAVLAQALAPVQARVLPAALAAPSAVSRDDA
jgi:hypothetical protein